ncbi:hypothetical protein CH251_13725 [Rhodococcus sp. 06-462-5]|nr:hypothetical protein CH251_13725 [Rhodococcus sp. 06-462-5]OZE63407.1 hypothetical protein CH270_18100 [Rhodococcus sp. 02-925g]
MVAYAFLLVMASATLPSPLYGLYRERDNLSAFTITLVYAIFAGGTIAALTVAPRFSVRLGRRGLMISATATMIVSAGLLAVWKDLPGLLIGRFLTGVAVGLAAATAITYLVELRLRADPDASVSRARIIGTSINVGGLGVGPLVAGALAQWVGAPLTVPYLLIVALGAIALLGLALTPETSTPSPTQPSDTAETSPRSSARLPVAAAAAALSAFAANGLFAGLSGLLLTSTLHHPAHALAGAILFLVFSAGVVSQLATNRLAAPRVLEFGTASILVGLVVLVVSVRLATPNLALFLLSGALIGAGAGAIYKGTTGIVLESVAPSDRLRTTSALLIALFLGLSVPVIGAGVALNVGASAPDAVFGFAILVAVGVAVAGWALLVRHPKNSTQTG